MRTAEQALLSFFERVARKDAAAMQQLAREPRFTLEPTRWCFKLPELHSFLQQQDDAFARIDYNEFRRLLYRSPVNRQTKLFGAEVVLMDNHGKVDRSSYALVWKTNAE